MSGIDASLHPVVLVALDNVPCAQGCCTANLFVRPGTTDAGVVQQVFMDGEFGFLWGDMPEFSPQTILDAGANIGAVSVLLALQYPHATIVSVEPSSENLRILQLNTARFGNIKCEGSALWPKSVHLRVSGISDSTRKGEWGIEVKESTYEQSNVEGVNIDALTEKYGIAGFDFLKIDIEGSEKALFEDYRNPGSGALRPWMKHAKLVVAEAHDDISPGALAAMQEAIEASYNVKDYMSGELHVWKLL